jgi:acyl-CoA thioesterase FadM
MATGPWIETCRGTVPPWECDVTEHWTIAYYFDRIAGAEAALAEELGLIDRLRDGGFTRRLDVRFAREFRAGSAFHIESAAIEQDGGPDGGQAGGGLRLGHRFVDSESGEITTWFDGRWDLAADIAADRLAPWDGPEFEARAEPTSFAAAIPTSRGRVKPGELDEFGRFGLAPIVHKFTDSCIQAGAAVGLTADYIKSARRAYSTFELRLRLDRALGLGAPFRIDSCIAQLGNSSVRFVHVMTDPRTGQEIGRLGQFGVQLDLDKRRPAGLAPELRERAQRLVAPTE